VEREPSRPARWRIACLVAGLILAFCRTAGAQLTTQEEERLRILSDPDAIRKKMDQKRERPPFEFFKSQVAPFDVLPFVKPHHWSTLTLELRANDDDYEGFLQSDPVALAGLPIDMVYRRDARLLKEQRRSLSQQVLLTKVPKEWTLSMVRPGALRADAPSQAILSQMEPHQALIVVLSKEATTHFASWSRMTSMIPAGAERDNPQMLDRQRYYRLVLPAEPDKLALSPHPLTWTTTSHVIWDGLPPDTLSVGQQEALLDWLHWGGQLIFTGGAGQAYALYRESFLGPYLPGEPTGQTVPLGEEELKPLSRSYPPPTAPFLPLAEDVNAMRVVPQNLEVGRIYQPPAEIRPAAGKPVYLAVLKPAAGASTIPLGESSPHLLAVERRVGRGRITMLTINPAEPVLANWRGLDTMVRRVVLRRPEESVLGPAGTGVNGYTGPRRGALTPQDLTWYRITGRDAQVGEDTAPLKPGPLPAPSEADRSGSEADADAVPREEAPVSSSGVADWRDSSRFSTLCRDLLEEASGIKIPSSGFVLRVILAYLIAVVPLNWLICRFVLNRREWAWIVVPLVAFAFAIGVQRGAAYDMGFDSASDELDLLEVQGDYPRAHLTRFASIYTSGRGNYAISYPSNNTALALPMGTGRTIPGEDRTTTIWQSTPVPTLSNLTVQPRSLSLFRAEEMATMAGAIRLEQDETGRKRVINDSELELRDATLIDVTGPDRKRWQERYLGTIAPGSSSAIDATGESKAPERIDAGPGPDLNTFLRVVRTTWEGRHENVGEIRLVAWVPRAMPGQAIEPPPDRLRGFTAVLVHLRVGPPPNPDGERYNRLALGPEKPMKMTWPTNPLVRPGMLRVAPGGGGRTKAALRPVPPPPTPPTPGRAGP
jgi:hypothetical protein